MLCENCHLNEAEVKLTVKSKDGMQEKWVCSTCAQGDNFQEMAFQEEKRCPTCHMTLKDIAHVGKFGCSNCYATFKDDILDIVRRVQGGQYEHVGKVPHSSYHKLALKKKIEEKKQYLQQLIDEQDFEQAAIVRDEIKSLSEESEVQHDE